MSRPQGGSAVHNPTVIVSAPANRSYGRVMRWPEPLYRGAIEMTYRLGGWPRRVAAVACLAAAGVCVLHDQRASRPETIGVVVTTRDLGAGTVLDRADIREVRWPRSQSPPTALRSIAQAAGAVTAAPMGMGEPVTAARLRGPGVTTGLPAGWVAATIVLDNAAAGGLVRAGDHVDVLSAPGADPAATEARRARVVASDVRVLDVLPGDGSAVSPATVVIAADLATSLDVASVGASPLTITLRGP